MLHKKGLLVKEVLSQMEVVEVARLLSLRNICSQGIVHSDFIVQCRYRQAPEAAAVVAVERQVKSLFYMEPLRRLRGQ